MQAGFGNYRGEPGQGQIGWARMWLHMFSGRVDHALALEGLLNAAPHPGAGIFHWNQQLGGFRNIAQVGNQVGTDVTGGEVLLLLSAAASVDTVRQDLLKLRARHESSPKGIRMNMLLLSFIPPASVQRRCRIPCISPSEMPLCSWPIVLRPSPPDLASEGHAASFWPCGAAIYCCRWNNPSSRQSRYVRSLQHRATQR